MNQILEKEQLNDLVWRYKIRAPLIANKRKAGQFIILRAESDGERIPLTIANADSAEGWIEIVFQAVGFGTKKLTHLNVGDNIPDLVGPLGSPTHIENFGKCLCIAGGVGAAPLYPIICALKAAGNHVTSIIGARTKNLLIFEERIQAKSDKTYIATDDGSKGYHGFVLDVFKTLTEHFDFAMIIGPPIMMKLTSKLTVAAGIKTFVSLNPIMIDGTGMCGGCRVTVDNQMKFACIDGPEFNAAGVDWDSLIKRLGIYKQIEKDHECNINIG